MSWAVFGQGMACACQALSCVLASVALVGAWSRVQASFNSTFVACFPIRPYDAYAVFDEVCPFPQCAFEGGE